MKPRLQEQGQALILIALAVVGLFGFSALAIDGSRVFSDRRHAQNAADTAALAAALAKIRGENYAQAALDRAASNGYVTDADSSVDVHLCSEVASLNLTPACEGLPGGADPTQYIQVRIVSTIPTTFARIIGRTQVTSVLTAVARASGAGPSPLFNGAALAALKPDGDNTLGGNGVVDLHVNNSGVFNNSSSNCGTTINGASGSYTVSTSFQFVSGTYCSGAGGGQLTPVQSASQIPYPPTITIPIPHITCSGNGSITPSKNVFNEDVNTFSPGNYGNVSISSTGHVYFQPGNYCFNGGVKIGGVVEVIANSVQFLITSGEFEIAGNSTFKCNDMLVHINGGSGMRFNGNGGNFCNSVTFVASTGDVSWLGTVTNRFKAPTGGDYKNVLLYMPYGNNSALKLTGNSSNQFTGSIIAVSSPITIEGVSGTTGLHSAIIGYTVTLSGHSNTTINYDPGEQYAQIDPSAVQLAK
jgi:Flp pilus assembly protein TadG